MTVGSAIRVEIWDPTNSLAVSTSGTASAASFTVSLTLGKFYLANGSALPTGTYTVKFYVSGTVAATANFSINTPVMLNPTLSAEPNPFPAAGGTMTCTYAGVPQNRKIQLGIVLLSTTLASTSPFASPNIGSNTTSLTVSSSVLSDISDGAQIGVFLNDTDNLVPPIRTTTTISVSNPKVTSYTLTVLANPLAYGTVAPPTASYAYGQVVTLVAKPNSGYYFVNWTQGGSVYDIDATTQVTVSGNMTLTANFSSSQTLVSGGTHVLSTSVTPPGSGTVIPASGQYASGQQVTLKATPASGYTFVNWTEGGTVYDTAASTLVTLSADVDIVANFAKPGAKPKGLSLTRTEEIAMAVAGGLALLVAGLAVVRNKSAKKPEVKGM